MPSHETSPAASSVVAKYGDKNDAAKLLGVKPRTIEKWTSERRIPHVRISHRCVRYRLDELEAWFDSFHVPVGGSVS